MRAIRVFSSSYNSLCVVPKYSFLKGKPYLLPIAWIYRFFVGRKRLGFAVNDAKNSFASQHTVAKRKSMYEQWGL